MDIRKFLGEPVSPTEEELQQIVEMNSPHFPFPTEKDAVLSRDYIHEKLSLKNSYTRFPALFELLFDSRVDSETFAEFLGEYFTLCDNLFNYKEEVRIAFNNVRGHKEKLMTKDAYELYESLPEKVTIYRGMTEKESRKRKNFGVSWTLEKKTAEFFAYEYGRNFSTADEPKTVLEAIVDKKDIEAIFLDRNESEVICLNITRKNLVKQKPNGKNPNKNT